MEILIIGGLFVALMVYVSTKIKKNAAEAFERETIESDEFRIVKPEGFIHPLRDESEFAFEAYSKSYGESEATEKFHQASATIRVHSDRTLDELKSEARAAVGTVTSEESLPGLNGQKIYAVRGTKSDNGAETEVSRKLVVANGGKIYDLSVAVLVDYLGEFAPKADEMIESFQVKQEI